MQFPADKPRPTAYNTHMPSERDKLRRWQFGLSDILLAMCVIAVMLGLYLTGWLRVGGPFVAFLVLWVLVQRFVRQ